MLVMIHPRVTFSVRKLDWKTARSEQLPAQLPERAIKEREKLQATVSSLEYLQKIVTIYKHCRAQFCDKNDNPRQKPTMAFS